MRSSDDLPILVDRGSLVDTLPLRRGAAARIAEFAVLLLRAMVIVLFMSPAFLAAALLFG